MCAIRIQLIDVSRARELRGSILRPGRPEAENCYPLDDDPASRHFGAFDGETLIGTASIFHQPAQDGPAPAHPGDDVPDWTGAAAWRLRGMTVVETRRNAGIGSRLLRACLDRIVRDAGPDAEQACLWCYARAPAEAFYRQHGLVAYGDRFTPPDAEPHLFMCRLVVLGE